jgi:hypothetical protein
MGWSFKIKGDMKHGREERESLTPPGYLVS